MSAKMRRLVAEALPPLTLPEATPHRSRPTDPMPRLRRIACLLTALALPALGIAAADTVHRVGETKASQAAAPVTPQDGAAAPSGARRLTRLQKTAALNLLPAEVRS
ncbi:hypothetical protein MKL09_18810 [Methylobacterium sp. J-048]|uniref:hypothetical protein n=1 Tax=Methylobacterium sp. J-048 TaxID=2836635 RepID=UPI001FB9A305|nr:hypothetical protein [Methylobacterium sp. J-048]MCJ2058591.1 hypothetical protein [Methylobacterium sp. J-048]